MIPPIIKVFSYGGACDERLLGYLKAEMMRMLQSMAFFDLKQLRKTVTVPASFGGGKANLKSIFGVNQIVYYSSPQASAKSIEEVNFILKVQARRKWDNVDTIFTFNKYLDLIKEEIVVGQSGGTAESICSNARSIDSRKLLYTFQYTLGIGLVVCAEWEPVYTTYEYTNGSEVMCSKVASEEMDEFGNAIYVWPAGFHRHVDDVTGEYFFCSVMGGEALVYERYDVYSVNPKGYCSRWRETTAEEILDLPVYESIPIIVPAIGDVTDIIASKLGYRKADYSRPGTRTTYEGASGTDPIVFYSCYLLNEYV